MFTNWKLTVNIDILVLNQDEKLTNNLNVELLKYKQYIQRKYFLRHMK